MVDLVDIGTVAACLWLYAATVSGVAFAAGYLNCIFRASAFGD